MSEEVVSQDPKERIRELNDRFRQGAGSGDVYITRSLSCLDERTLARILAAVRGFDGFDEDNDPHGEHDFGALDVEGIRIFWKIDYYDRGRKWASPDPSDPSVTTRVLTVMRSEDY